MKQQNEHFTNYYLSKSELEFFNNEIMPTEIDDPFIYDGYIPGWASHTAVDYNGDVYAYSHYPVATAEYWTLAHPDRGNMVRLESGTEYCPDWIDSVREVI